MDRLLAPEGPLQYLSFLAKRFVAGETIRSALEAVRTLNGHGLRATLDFLGEDVTKREDAMQTRNVYLDLLGEIERKGAGTNVSVKLTALGLLIDEELAVENLTTIVERAAGLPDPFVRIDMEGSVLTDATLRVFERVHAQHRNVGPVLQAYLRRTPADVERAIALQARVRLCKGAYNEPARIAYKDMPAIRREFLRMAEALLVRGNYPGIATHDAIIRHSRGAHVYARARRSAPTVSSSRCSTASGPKPSATSSATATRSAYTCPSGGIGPGISTAASWNAKTTRSSPSVRSFGELEHGASDKRRATTARNDNGSAMTERDNGSAMTERDKGSAMTERDNGSAMTERDNGRAKRDKRSPRSGR